VSSASLLWRVKATSCAVQRVTTFETAFANRVRSTGGVQYRILYGYHAKNVAILVHAVTKEARVKDADIELAIQRLELVRTDPLKFTAELDL